MLWLRAAVISLAVFLGACGGGGGGDSGGNPVAPTVSLDAAPASMVAGGAATLTWNSTDATDCTASGAWSGSRGVSGSAGTGALSASAIYTLTCTGPGGSAAQTATVTVTPAPAPVVNLSATPPTVNAGAAATLNWSATNATSCLASGGWNGIRATNGSQSTGNLSGNASFTLTCSGAGGAASRTASVTVIPVVGAPTVSLAANPSNVSSGASSTLTWSSTDATGCTASGGWSGSRGTSGSFGTGSLVATTGYTLTCTGPGGSANQTVTVTVTPPAPTVTIAANPASIASGASSTLTWSTTNATACTASGGWSGSKGTSGTASTGALTATTTFTLSCTGAGGTASQSATVTVTPPAPTVTFSASPTSIASGASSTLTWSTSNADDCTASGGWSGSKGTGGTASTGALTATTSFGLSCTGTGGTTARSATVTVAASGSPFPLRVEAGKRYLITAQGQPFLMHGDTPWCLITQLTREEVDDYLEDRRLKGFNTILIELVEHFFSTNAPADVYGDAPFLTAGDFSTPNEAYFAHAEYVIAKAREKGMLVLITPAYLGFGGGNEGWYDEMGQNGNVKLFGYGNYVATRFQAYDNILWVHGGDYNPPDRTRMRAIVDGILDVETTRLHTFHGSRGTAALQFLGTSETWLDVNNIYTALDTVVAEAQGEYNRSTMPFFLIEARYENENSATGTDTRQQAWQTVLSGATGHLMGQRDIWPFNSSWRSFLNTEGASTLIHLRTLLESYAWWTLVPDFGNVFLTGNFGTGKDRAPAALAADGSFAFIYVRTGLSLTVDTGALSGAQVQARWYDPTNGSFATVSGSPFTPSGSQSFLPPGTNSLGDPDWVLVLDAIP